MNRTIALMHTLGWQGGTVHQVGRELNLNTYDIIYADAQKETPEYKKGFNDIGNGVVDFSRKGDLQYWLGVAERRMLNHIIATIGISALTSA